jgi:hypothetical protein
MGVFTASLLAATKKSAWRRTIVTAGAGANQLTAKRILEGKACYDCFDLHDRNGYTTHIKEERPLKRRLPCMVFARCKQTGVDFETLPTAKWLPFIPSSIPCRLPREFSTIFAFGFLSIVANIFPVKL